MRNEIFIFRIIFIEIIINKFYESLEEEKGYIEAKIRSQFNARFQALEVKIEELQDSNLEIKKIEFVLHILLNQRQKKL